MSSCIIIYYACALKTSGVRIDFPQNYFRILIICLSSSLDFIGSYGQLAVLHSHMRMYKLKYTRIKAIYTHEVTISSLITIMHSLITIMHSLISNHPIASQ